MVSGFRAFFYFKKLAATHRAGSSFKVANTSSISHFSFLPALGFAQFFFTKAFFRGFPFYKFRVIFEPCDMVI